MKSRERRSPRSGEVVAALGGQDQINDMRGIVSYRYDGYEDRLIGT